MAAKPNVHRIKKIAINKSDEVAFVVEKLIDSEAQEIVLNIPRFSKLADSLSNFHLIAREAKLLGKKIVVESVDDKVIELANLSGLESLNPILSRSRRQFYDIVSSKKTREANEEEGMKTRKLSESVHQKKPMRRLLKNHARNFIGGGAVLAVVITAGIFAANVLPRADIKIITTKTSWPYKDSVRAEKLAAIDSVSATIPGQLFTEKKSHQLSFPATGKKNIEQKATGAITIYNAYSSDPQPLVATTRFVAPDGKVFRLAKSVTVPAAKIVEGKIIASTLDTDVVADQPGPTYNLGPVSYFSIPGFKGTAKYQGFYGESKTAMTGGFVGEAAFPTDADIKKGKSTLAETLDAMLKVELTKKIPVEFKIIDGASGFIVSNQVVSTRVDAANNFAVSADGQLNAVAFKETDLMKMLEKKINKELGGDYVIKTNELSYGKARADFANGRISFPIDFKSQVAKRIDAELLKSQVLGKSEKELRTLINALPDIESIGLSRWPFWVNRVPKNLSKVTLVID
ncbi:MAG: hypothetical protein AAB389_03045 [Patescibacteria group bacterium]